MWGNQPALIPLPSVSPSGTYVCSFCEWPVDLVVNSAVASFHRQVYLQRAASFVSETPPSANEARSLDGCPTFVIVMKPSRGQRCRQYESQTHWIQKLLPPSSPSCLPPLLPPAFPPPFLFHKETLPHLALLYAAGFESREGRELI